MSFLDSLLGSKTNAASNQANALGNSALSSIMQGNDQVLTNTATSAGDLASTGAANATGAINSGYGAAKTDLTNYDGSALAAIQNGVTAGTGTLGNASSRFDPYAAAGTAANGLYADSLGINGAAGNAAATSAFQTSPGYAFQVDQATDAAARKAASLGMAASGNTLDAITRLGSNLADQEYGNWQQNLSGLSQQGQQAISAQNQDANAIANMQYGSGTAQAGLLQQTGSGLGTLDSGMGTADANIQSGLGSSLASIQSGLGTNMVNNNTGLTTQIVNNGNRNAQAVDATQNANNSILSNFINSGLSTGLKAVKL